MIKEARQTNKLTQKQVASRCKLSQSYLSKLEKRTNEDKNINPSLKQVIKIAKELDLNANDLSNWFINKLSDNKNNLEFSQEISFTRYDINKNIKGR